MNDKAARVNIYGVEWTAGTARLLRTLDWIIVPIVVLAVMAGFHIHFMLLAGDWDFWVDWKDRQFWVTITPVVAITFPAALQYVFWEKFRLPFGATVAAVTLVVGAWIVRVHGFHGWSYFPYSLIWPAVIIPGALVLDVVLMLTRNFLLTAIIGGMSFALLFYPANWPLLAVYRLPMEAMGNLVSVGDYIGYAFTRTATPEYLRLIERGTLRTFGGHSQVVASFFAGFLCILTYVLWWYMGRFFALVLTVPNQLRSMMGMGGTAPAKTDAP